MVVRNVVLSNLFVLLILQYNVLAKAYTSSLFQYHLPFCTTTTTTTTIHHQTRNSPSLCRLKYTIRRDEGIVQSFVAFHNNDSFSIISFKPYRSFSRSSRRILAYGSNPKQNNNNNNNQDNDSHPNQDCSNDGIMSRDVSAVLIDFIENVVTILLKPLPVAGNISVIFLVCLVLQTLLFPFAQSLLSIVLFAMFSYGGKKIIVLDWSDEYDTTESEDSLDDFDAQSSTILLIDTVAFVFSFFSASLIAPTLIRDTVENRTDVLDKLLVPFVILSVLGVVVAFFTTVNDIQKDEVLTPDEKLLNRWDMKFQKDRRRQKENDD